MCYVTKEAFWFSTFRYSVAITFTINEEELWRNEVAYPPHHPLLIVGIVQLKKFD